MKTPDITTAAGWRAEIMKLLRANAHRFDLWQVWSDYVEMMALAIANRFDPRLYDEREARYSQIAKPYSLEERQRFAHAYGALVMAMELSGFADVLGSVFMELELGNKWKGQFFTPYHLCHTMGILNLNEGGEIQGAIDRKGYFLLNDPCTGGGAMVIGMAHALKDKDINYQECMYAVAQDLDLRAVHMAYVQLSLLHIPAVVIHGNTLTLEELSHWYTPAHFMGLWQFRLRRDQKRAEAQNEPQIIPEIIPTPPVPGKGGQFSLFEEAA